MLKRVGRIYEGICKIQISIDLNIIKQIKDFIKANIYKFHVDNVRSTNIYV